MADITTTFRYDGDFGPLRSQIKALSKDVSILNLQFKSFETAAKNAMMGAAKSYLGEVNAIKGYKTAMVDLTSTIDRFGMAVSRSKLSLKEYTQEAFRAFSSTSKTRQLAEREVAKLQSTFIELGNIGGRRRGILSTPLGLDMTNLANKTAVARKQFEIFNTLVQDGATKLIDFGKNTQWAGRQLMVGLTLPLVAFGQALSKTFLEAETEIIRFAKVYGSDLKNQTYESTEAMKEQVMSLSKTIAKEFGISVKETNALAADLAAAGYEGQKLLDMVTQTSRLAVLGEVDRQEALKATLSLQTAFNLNTQELADSINFLNSVENQTSTSLQDLISAIPRTGPVMNAMGGNVKDLAALLVAMKEGGVAAGEGANALKSGLASLINPTQKASEFAKKFGIDLQGIVQSTGGELMPTILKFQDALKGLNEFGRARVIEEIFGKYQFARISALFDNLNRDGSQTIKVMELSKMSTTELAKQAYRELRILTDSAPTQLKRGVESLKAELLPLGATIVKNIIPVIQTVGDIVGKVVDFLEKLPGPLKTFLKFSTAIGALLGPVVMLSGLFANFKGNIIKLTMNLVNLGRAFLGIKSEKFQFLDNDALAAKIATDGLTKSFYNQELALTELNVALTTYVARLNEIRMNQPGLMFPAGRGPAPMVRRASGGYVSGPGGPTEDKIPAMLSDGEYVIRASSVNKYGKETLDNINAGKFAAGGIAKFPGGGMPRRITPKGSGITGFGMTDKSILRALKSLTVEEQKIFARLFGINPSSTNDLQKEIIKSLTSKTKYGAQRGHLQGRTYDKETQRMVNLPYIPGITAIVPSEFNQLLKNMYPLSVSKTLMKNFPLTKRVLSVSGQPQTYDEAIEMMQFFNYLKKNSSKISQSPYFNASEKFLGKLISGGKDRFDKRMSILRKASDASRTGKQLLEAASSNWTYRAQGGPIYAAGGIFAGGKSVLQVMQERQAREAVMESMIPKAALVRGSINVGLFKKAWKQVDWSKIKDPEEFIQSKYREMLIHPKSAARQGFFDPYSPMTPQFAKKIEEMEIERGVQALMDEPMMAAFRAREARAQENKNFWVSMMGEDAYQTMWQIEDRARTDAWQRAWLSKENRRRYNAGGKVFGAGGPIDDKIPAYLSNGEYVVKADSVKKYGVGFMDALNSGKFAMGGIARLSKGGGPRIAEKTHITDPLVMGPKQASEFLTGRGTPIQNRPSTMLGTLIQVEEQALAAGLGDLRIKIKLLSDLVAVLSPSLNNALKGAGVSLETFKAEFSAGRDKWIHAVMRAGESTQDLANDESELSKALDAWERKILENLQKMGGAVTDPKLAQAQTQAQAQLTAAQRKTLGPIIALGNQYNTMRVVSDLTEQEFETIRGRLKSLGISVVRNGKALETNEGVLIRLTDKQQRLNNLSFERITEEQILSEATSNLSRARNSAAAKTTAAPIAPVVGGGAIAPKPMPTPGGNMMNMMGLASTVAFLPMSLQGLAGATDAATKAMMGFSSALMIAMTAMQVKSMIPSGGLGVFKKGAFGTEKALKAGDGRSALMLGKSFIPGKVKKVGVPGKGALLAGSAFDMGVTGKGGARYGVKEVTGIGGMLQAKGAAMAFKEGAEGGKAVAQTGAKAAFGRGLMSISSGLSNPYVLAGVATVATISAAIVFYKNQHKKALQEAREYGMAAWKDPTEAAKRYGFQLITVNSAIKENSRLAGRAFGAAPKSKKVTDKDLEYVVKKDFSGAVKNVIQGTTEQAQNELMAVMTNLIASGAPKEVAIELVQEIARQAGKSNITSDKTFLTNLLGIKDVEAAVAGVAQVINNKLTDAMNKYSGGFGHVFDAEKMAVAVSETIGGAIDTATKIAASDPTKSYDLITGILQNKEAIAAGGDYIVGELLGRLSAQGLGSQTMVAAFMGNKENLGTGLSEQILTAMTLGVDLGKVEDTLKNKTIEGAEAAIKYINAEQTARIQAQKQISKFAEDKKGILVEDQKQANQAFEAKMKQIDAEIEAEDKKHKSFLDRLNEEKDALEKRKNLIEKNAQAYIDALQKQQDAEDFYSEQRNTTLGGLKALAGGDVFGFAQARQDLQTQAESKGREDTIAQIEQTKQAAIDAIDARLQAIDDEQKLEDKRHEKRIENLNAEKDAVLAQQSVVNKAYQDSIDLLSKMQTASLTEQQVLMTKWNKLYTGKNSPVGKVRDATKFFDDKTKKEIQQNANDLDEIFQTVPQTMGGALEKGIKASAKKYKISESALRGALYGSLSSDYKAEAKAQGTDKDKTLKAGAEQTGFLSGDMTTLPDFSKIGGKQLTQAAKPLTQTSTGKKISKSIKEWEANLPIWKNKEDIPEYAFLKDENQNPYFKLYTDKDGNNWKYYVDRATSRWMRDSKLGGKSVGSHANGIKAFGWADGGHILGAGTSTSDSIPAMLSNGEYVVNAAAVKKIGLPAMNAINSGRIPMAAGGMMNIPALRYNSGGLVSPTYSTPSSNDYISAPATSSSSSESTIVYNTITINANSANAADVYNEFERRALRLERGAKMGSNI